MSDDTAAGDAHDELAWETRESRVAYTCPGFEIRHDEVTLPDGTETDFDYLAEPPAVVVLPFTPDGDVVCIEEWRQAVGHVNFGLPVGTVEDDDVDLSTAAHRELTEETGYEADTVEPLVTVEPANGIANSEFNLFVARGCTPDADQDLDADESIRPTTRPYEELRDAVAAGEIRDGRTVLAVGQYELVDGR